MEDATTPTRQYLRWLLDGATMPLLVLGPLVFWVFTLISLPLLLPLWALFGVHAWQAAPLVAADAVLAWASVRRLVSRIVRHRRTELLLVTAAWLWAVVPCVGFWILYAVNGAD